MFWPVSHLDPNPGFESGSETNFRPDPDPKVLFRIRNTSFCIYGNKDMYITIF
jgi:hypothetical protein